MMGYNKDYMLTLVSMVLYLVLQAQGRSFLNRIDDGDEKTVIERTKYQLHNNKRGTILTGIYGPLQPSQPSIKPHGHKQLTNSLHSVLLAEGSTLTRTYEGRSEEVNKDYNVFSQTNTKDTMPPYQIENNEMTMNGKAKENDNFSQGVVLGSGILLDNKKRLRLRRKQYIVSKPKEKVATYKQKQNDSDEALHIKAYSHVNDDNTYTHQTLVVKVNGILKGDENKETPTLEIPNRYLKIPHSKHRLDRLVKGMKLRHPCVKRDVQINGNDLKGKSTDNILLRKDYLKLCKNINRNLRHKHRKESKKNSEHYQADDSENITVKPIRPKKENEMEFSESTNKLSGTSSNKNTKDTDKKQYHFQHQIDKIDNMVIPIETQHSTPEKTKNNNPKPNNPNPTSIFPQQFSNFNKETDVAPVLSDKVNGVNYTSKCLLGHHDDTVKPENLKKLIDELDDNECWQSGALRGVYHLEELYKHSVDGSKLSQNDIDGLDRIICYLIEELRKCKSSQLDINDMQVSTSTTTTPTTTTRAQQTSTTEQHNIEKNNFQKGFDLDWEANLLFY